MPSGKKIENRPKKLTTPKAKGLTSKPQPDLKKTPAKVTLKIADQERKPSKSTVSVTSARKSSKWQTLEDPKSFNFLEDLVNKTELENAIAEVISTGSSSELEEIEDIKEIESVVNLEILEEDNLLNFDIEAVEMSLSEEEEGSYEHEDEAESETDFLHMFEDVPSVDEVSIDKTEQVKKEKPSQAQAVLPKKLGAVIDTGRFFDPLTGERIVEKVSSEEFHFYDHFLIDEEEEEEFKITVGKGGEAKKKGFAVTDDLSKGSSDDFLKGRDSLAARDDALDVFFEIAKQEEGKVAEDDIGINEALLREQLKLQTERIISDFLQKLIDRCVDQAEFSESEAFLKKSLDKFKLMCNLKTTNDEREFEKSRSLFLNKKIVFSLKRKGFFRSITAEDPKDLEMLRNKFTSSLCELDKWLSIEKKTKAKTSNEIDNLKIEFDEMKEVSNEEVKQLEQLMSTTFQRKHFDKLGQSVEKQIRKISTIRKEISQVRLRLLLEQHEYCCLKTQLDKLEDLGNGLNVRDYESLQTETVAVSKKIEEINSTLEKLHGHFNDDLHRLGHLKEKKSITKNLIEAQTQFFDELLEKEDDLLDHIHQLKVKRNHLKREAGNLLQQTGLLSNQTLMRDYDETAERADELRQTNENLRRTIEELNLKIAKLS